MFTKKDYEQYFGDLEKELARCIVIYTDLLNMLDNKSVSSRISVLTSECLEAYRILRDEKTKLGKLKE